MASEKISQLGEVIYEQGSGKRHPKPTRRTFFPKEDALPDGYLPVDVISMSRDGDTCATVLLTDRGRFLLGQDSMEKLRKMLNDDRAYADLQAL